MADTTSRAGTVLAARPGTAASATAAPGAGAGRGRSAQAQRLPSLTGLRWLAAFVVFAFHLGRSGYFTGDAGRWLNVAFDRGMLGVSFFFVLSGFVLAVSARPGDRATSFWRRRFARIYPLHLATALLALGLGATIVDSLPEPGRWSVVANLGLVSSWWPSLNQVVNPVSWSLVCEAFFYLSFPLLWWVVRRESVRVAAITFWLAVAATIAVPLVHLVVPDIGFTAIPGARLPEFVAGVAAARLLQLGAWRGPGLLGSTVLTLVGYFVGRTVDTAYGFAAFTVLGFVCVIAAAARRDQRGGRSVWAHPVLVRLGELSFAFYLVHLLVLNVINTYTDHRGLVAQSGFALLGFAAALGLSWVLNVVVEVPARRAIVGGARPREALRRVRAVLTA